ncbi:hypothetical protein Tco_0963008 [Tanacetum coccineum]
MESYYSRFHKMMIEMIKNNLIVATMQVNVQFLQQLQPEWSRFVTILKQSHDLDTMSYHKLFDVLKQYQKEVNEIRADRIAKNANPLALIAAAQQYQDPYYQAPKSFKSYAQPSKQASSTRSTASTKFKGKEIAKLITPPSESASDEDSDPEQAQRDKDMQKNLALIAKVKDYTYHKEKMLLCKQAEKGVPLQAEQVDWLEDTDEEIDEQELEAHYDFMAKIQEVDSNVIPDLSDMCDNDIQTDQNAEDKRAALANLITELKKYMTLNDRTVDYDKLEFVKEKHDELVKHSLLTKSHYEGLVKEKTKRAQSEKPYLYEIQYDTSDPANRFTPDREETLTLDKENRSKLNKDLVKPYDYTKQNSLYEIFKPASKEYHDQLAHANAQEMHADLKYVESLEKEIDELEYDKAEFSNMYDLLLQECVSKDVTCSYLNSLSEIDAHAELKCLYDHKVKECECLAQKLSNKAILNKLNCTKNPKVVPINTRQPKSQANKSVATPSKKIVALEFTIQKSKSYYRMLYEKTSKAWKWWIEQQFPS